MAYKGDIDFQPCCAFKVLNYGATLVFLANLDLRNGINEHNVPSCLSNFASMNAQTFAQEFGIIYDLDLTFQIFEQPWVLNSRSKYSIFTQFGRMFALTALKHLSLPDFEYFLSR